MGGVALECREGPVCSSAVDRIRRKRASIMGLLLSVSQADPGTGVIPEQAGIPDVLPRSMSLDLWRVCFMMEISCTPFIAA